MKGKILGYGFVLCTDHVLQFHTAAPQAAGIVAHLDRYIIREDVELNPVAEQRQVLLAGPDSRQLIAGALNIDAPADRFSHLETVWRDSPVRVCRMDLYGPDGFLIGGKGEALTKLIARWMQDGAVGCSSSASDLLRIRWGTPVSVFHIRTGQESSPSSSRA